MGIRRGLTWNWRRRGVPRLVDEAPVRPDPPTNVVADDTVNIYRSQSIESRSNVRRPRRSITRRTSQLPIMSKVLYRVDYYASLPTITLLMVGVLSVMFLIGVLVKFRQAWVTTFEVTASTVTLLMVFTIQHTQGREQAATQLKLDELLRAIPGAAESLMMLEEAPHEFMIEIEDSQRDIRADLVDNIEEFESADCPEESESTDPMSRALIKDGKSSVPRRAAWPIISPLRDQAVVSR